MTSGLVPIVALCVLVAGGVWAWGVFVAPYRYRLARRAITLPDASSDALGVTVLHISDLHFRKRDEKKLRFIKSLAELSVDLVCVTGDLIEDDEGRENCVEALRGLKGRYGTFAVLGSHDYYKHRLRDVLRHFLIPGDRSAVLKNSVELLVEALRGVGVRVLRNESVRVELNGRSLRLVGVDDPYLKLHDLRAAMDGTGPDEFKIMLVHTPEIVEEANAAGIHLVLAGHTHGGQVRIPGVGALVTHCALPARCAAGVFTRGRTTFHINHGVGVGKFTGIRFCCPPEVTLLTISNKANGHPVAPSPGSAS